MVNLWAHFHGFSEWCSTSWQDHELLHSQFITGMATTVDDVESWHWKDDVLVTGQIGDMLVQWNSLFGCTCFSNSQWNAQQSIGTVFRFIFSSVQFQQEVINFGLLCYFQTSLDQFGSQWLVDIVNSLLYTFSMIVVLIVIAQFQSFMNTGRCTGWNGGTE